MSSKTNSEKEKMDNKPYWLILGPVMWGQLATQPNLSFSISLLACFQANSRIDHWNALMHVIGYIKNTINYGLTYSHDFDLSPTAFVDADSGGCRDTHCSTLGYVFLMAGGLVTWSSKHQTTVTLSTVEAEYVAMSQCMQQVIWMHSWLREVGIEYSLPGLIKGDNSGAITLTKNTKDHGKIKHVNIHHHYIHELLYSRAITIEHVSSTDNLADLFTKPLSHNHHHYILSGFHQVALRSSPNGLRPQGLKEYSDSYSVSDYLGPVLGSKCLVMQTLGNYLGLGLSEETSEKMFQVATRTFNLLYYYPFMYTYRSHFSG
jgi:hypothetical protein